MVSILSCCFRAGVQVTPLVFVSYKHEHTPCQQKKQTVSEN